jgi:tRNA pseudouridine38-40 synthase
VTESPSAAGVYRIDLKYNGAAYHGWQSQPSRRGIQDHVEQALKVFLRHDVRVIAASRTDTGVHAEHQVAIFRSAASYDHHRWLKSLHGLLPEDIGVTRLEPCAEGFHPIYAAKGKAYVYRIWTHDVRHPMLAPYCWTLWKPLDVAAMRAGAKALVGTHDFTSFCAVDSSAKTKTRNVLEIEVVDKGALVEIWVTGEGFLKQMIRNFAGTLADVGLGKLAPTDVAKILAVKDREAASMTAPGQGLTLVEIFFDQIPSVASIIDRRRDAFSIGL